MKKESFGFILVFVLVGVLIGAVIWVPITSKIVRHNLKEEMWHPTQCFGFGHVEIGYSLDQGFGDKWENEISDLVQSFTMESGKAFSLALSYDDPEQIRDLRRKIIDSPKEMVSSTTPSDKD